MGEGQVPDIKYKTGDLSQKHIPVGSSPFQQTLSPSLNLHSLKHKAEYYLKYAS